MSAKIMGAVWELELTPAKQIVLLAYADHADHSGRNVRPSLGLVAWKTGYSERQIRRVVKELVADGLLVVESQRAGYPIVYRIDLSAGIHKPEYKPKKEKVGQIVTPDIAMSPLTQLSPEGGGHSYVPPTPDVRVLRASDEPSIKPSIKPSVSPEGDSAKPRNPMYDAIEQVWGYTGGLNGALSKMLTGVSTKNGFKEANITPAVTPDELLQWAVWYRNTELHGDMSLNMLEDRLKIASSITKFRTQKPAHGSAHPDEYPLGKYPDWSVLAPPDLEPIVTYGSEDDDR